MDDSGAHYATLLRAIATVRQQIALLPLSDPRRDPLYRDLLWCYQEALALLYRRFEALRASRISGRSQAAQDRLY